MNVHCFHGVDFVTNGVGYVSTSFPKGGRQIYLDMARSLRETMIGPRPIYKQFTPTLFYPDATQASADQLCRVNHPLYKLDFNHSPVVAVFGALHPLFRPCYHRMGRIVCVVGAQNIDQIEWGLSLAAARLHIKQYYGLTWGQPDEKKESLIGETAANIVAQLRERRSHAEAQTGLKRFVGQEGLLTLLEDEVIVAKTHRSPLPNMVFSGPPGLGKTKLANILARELDVDCESRMGSSLNIQSLSEFIGSTNCVGYDDDGNVVDSTARRPSIRIIEESEKTAPELLRDLHFAIERDGNGKRCFQAKLKGSTGRPWIWVPDFTMIFCTNYLGAFSKRGAAVISRCPIKYTFQIYNQQDMFGVVTNLGKEQGIKIDSEATAIIAERSLGIPRGAANIIERCKTKILAMVARGQLPAAEVITPPVVEEVMEMLGLDQLGLDTYAIKYLKVLGHSEGVKTGVKTLASQIGLDVESVETDIEPLLLRAGLIDIGSGGRAITEKGLSHIGRGQINSLKARVIRK